MELTKINEVKLRLNIEDTNYDNAITSYLNETITRVNSYCNRDTLPDELFYTVVAIAEDYIKLKIQELDTDIEKSISIGDTSTSYATRKKFNSIDEIIKANSNALNKYRYVRISG